MGGVSLVALRDGDMRFRVELCEAAAAASVLAFLVASGVTSLRTRGPRSRRCTCI
jgi:hypothetical protein